VEDILIDEEKVNSCQNNKAGASIRDFSDEIIK